MEKMDWEAGKGAILPEDEGRIERCETKHNLLTLIVRVGIGNAIYQWNLWEID